MTDKPDHHHSDGTFRNPPRSPSRNAPASEYFRFFLRRVASNFTRLTAPQGHSLSQEQAKAQLLAHGTADTLTWLGHAAFLFQLQSKRILVDPYLSDTAGPGPFGPRRFVPSGLGIADLPDIDAVLITHNHYDHLDLDTLRRLPNKSTLPVIVPLRLGSLIERIGFRNIIELDWHQTHAIGDTSITALPAVHWSKRGLNDECRTLWCSYGLQTPDTKLFFSGDTGYGPVFKELGQQYGPFDLTVVGIGAYEPRSIMRASHATPEEAIQISRDLRSENILGMHWGTVILSDEDPWEPPERFHAAALQAGYSANQVWRLAIGETRALSE